MVQLQKCIEPNQTRLSINKQTNKQKTQTYRDSTVCNVCCDSCAPLFGYFCGGVKCGCQDAYFLMTTIETATVASMMNRKRIFMLCTVVCGGSVGVVMFFFPFEKCSSFVSSFFFLFLCREFVTHVKL